MGQAKKKPEANKQKKSKDLMNIVIAGHVDHGKSTIIGRMLNDTGSLPEGKLEQVKETCRRNSKPFEYAFLLDALKDEQSQGITIDSARVFFSTKQRDYVIIDAPGHIEFLKNMVTGASRAEAAFLVIDAEEGIQENSRRHGYMVSMLGLKKITVLVNKMDLVDYKKNVFDNIVEEYTKFLADIGLESSSFIPVSGVEGANIAELSKDKTPWYQGQTVLQALDAFKKEPPAVDKPFRMPVQGVYKFTRSGDDRRIVAGTIATGEVNIGDDVIFYPSGKQSRVKTIEEFNAPEHTSKSAGEAAAFTLDEQIFIKRGQYACRADQPAPEVSKHLRANIFWMGRKPMVPDKEYFIKTGTAKRPVWLESVEKIIDASNLSATEKDKIEHHDVAECRLSLRHAVAFDLADKIPDTGRFVIVDDYEIVGGGIITEALADEQNWARDYVMRRNLKWVTSSIAKDERADRYNQAASLIVVTGEKDSGKKTLAKALEAKLFSEGKFVYFLGIGNVLYGVDADIKTAGKDAQKPEHLRRLGEVANVLLDAGLILIVTAIDLNEKDLELIETTVDTDSINVVWLGDEPANLECDLIQPPKPELEYTVGQIKSILQDKGIIFKP
jgi:bifunctional enzyme CysN/CysC